MSEINTVSAEVVEHYNNLHRFLDSGLIDPAVEDFVRMEIAAIERDTGIKPRK
ncbi:MULTISPECIES: hypothetical protein [Paenibacillus]|uniref:Uncharacterized protein n=1 Tax=Paenibacillus albilobatus TaxID=2716884 RepID=A0A919XP49_9BACL|nr:MULTISPECIES: hypothetical protein [Paenibacillus]GIO33708.1 hypothetical protein J2TS6_48490 [Paenibacillus albilobatus]